MGRWNSYQKLNGADRRLLLLMSLLVPVVAVSVRCFGFSRVFFAIGRLAGTPAADSTPNAEAFTARVRELTRYIKLKGVYRGNCLSRSLMMWLLLRRRGICCDLIVGSRFQDGEFEAHAWVERDAQPLNANKLVRQRYAVFEHDLVPDGSLRTMTN